MENIVKPKFTEAEYDKLAKSVIDGEISLAAAELLLETKYASHKSRYKFFWNAYYRHAVPAPEFVNIRVNIKSQQSLEAMKQGQDDTIANVVERMLLKLKKVV